MATFSRAIATIAMIVTTFQEQPMLIEKFINLKQSREVKAFCASKVLD